MTRPSLGRVGEPDSFRTRRNPSQWLRRTTIASHLRNGWLVRGPHDPGTSPPTTGYIFYPYGSPDGAGDPTKRQVVHNQMAYLAVIPLEVDEADREWIVGYSSSTLWVEAQLSRQAANLKK